MRVFVLLVIVVVDMLWLYPVVNPTELITYMKKYLDSDWLRAVQLKSNTSAKSVIPVQKAQYQCKKRNTSANYNKNS